MEQLIDYIPILFTKFPEFEVSINNLHDASYIMGFSIAVYSSEGRLH